MVMFTPCCVRLVFVLCVTGSGLLADCVCTYVFVAVMEFVFAFCFFCSLLPCLCPGSRQLLRGSSVQPQVAMR